MSTISLGDLVLLLPRFLLTGVLWFVVVAFVFVFVQEVTTVDVVELFDPVERNGDPVAFETCYDLGRVSIGEPLFLDIRYRVVDLLQTVGVVPPIY